MKSLRTLSVPLLLLFNANVAKDDLQSLLRLSFYGMCVDWTETRTNPSVSAGIPNTKGVFARGGQHGEKRQTLSCCIWKVKETHTSVSLAG